MRVISKKDLLLLIPMISDRNSFDLDDFKVILNRFGDEYFCVDGQFQLVNENEEMKRLRQMDGKGEGE